MESMVTEPETMKREIDISNDIREGEANVYGHGPLTKRSPVLVLTT